MISELTVRTKSASQYLQQLCKHFAHKVPARHDPTSGKVDFPFGTSEMVADSEILTIRCDCPDPSAQETMHRVIEDHLVRFAWREKLDVEWRAVSEAGSGR